MEARIAVAVAWLVGNLAAQAPISFPLAPMHSVKPGVVPGGEVALADCNADGIPDLVVGNAFLQLPPSGAFAIVAMDPDGASVGQSHGGPLSGSGSGKPRTVGVVAADVVGSSRPDVLVLDSDGRISLFENVDHTRRQNGFGEPRVVADLRSTYGQPGPFEVVSIPFLLVDDVNGDGHRDLVLAGHFVDLIRRTSRPTDLHVHYGDGTGSFPLETTFPLQGRAVAGQLVDADGNGRRETLVLLTDGAAGTTFVEWYQDLSSRLVPSLRSLGAQQLSFPGRATNLQVADLDADGKLDYVVSMFHPVVTGRDAEIWTLEGGVLGRLGRAYLQPVVPSPAQVTEVQGLRVVDIDRDGNLDILAVQARGGGAPARMLLLRGTGGVDLFAPETFDLPATLDVANASHTSYVFEPHVTAPNQLEITDFDLDGNPDAVVAGLHSAGEPVMGTFKNALPRAPWGSRVRFLGVGTRAVSGFDAKIGWPGGPPVLGATETRVSLTEVPAGVPCALHYGPVEYVVEVLGLTLYTVPILSFPVVTSRGSGPGGGPGGGYAEIGMPVPNNPWLIGNRSYYQWAYLDPGASGLPVALSDAVEVTIGR